MDKQPYPRLTGGTFFVLLLQALKQRTSARKKYDGDKDGLSDPEVFVGLIKVINPEYQSPKIELLKTKTNQYKSCSLSNGTYLPFKNQAEIEAFDERVRNDYHEVLTDMSLFVSDFLEIGTMVQKDVLLIKALIDLIEQDDSISDDEEFYICENGNTKKKIALHNLQQVCFPAFLLGVWHYIVVNRSDNSLGQATYDIWCPKRGGATRIYTGSMGKSITQEIEVYMPQDTESTESAAETDSENPECSFDNTNQKEENQSCNFGDTNKREVPPHAQQVVNNPVFIQQNGNNNVLINNKGTINLTLGKNRGGSDEQ